MSYALKQASASVPKKPSQLKRHHGYSVVLFIFGTLLPPLAVAARFGIGKDFWINVLLTLCGYFPGHGHNFYIQNVRNNKNHKRTPKWAQRYGLIDTSDIKRKERKSQWANRYNDRLPRSTLEDQPYAEGEVGGSSIDISSADGHTTPRQEHPGNGGALWRPEDESYYQANDSASSSGRWHYPANFESAAAPAGGSKRSKKKEKKDRWARTEDAYSIQEERSKKKKSKKNKRSATTDSIQSGNSDFQYPEDAGGGQYRGDPSTEVGGNQQAAETDLNHEF